MSSPPRIIIIGAGLGGLALAQGLKAAHIPFTLFERDTSATYRPQGYRLRIGVDGSADLRAVLPPPLFRLFEDTSAITKLGYSFINALSGERVSRKEGEPGRKGNPTAESKVYTADRARLRDVLMRGLEDEIHWGKAFVRYTLDPAAEYPVTAEFADGSTARGSVLVGADGVRSAVRRQLLPAGVPRIVDTGGRAIYGKTLVTPELEARVPAEALEWMTIISSKPGGGPRGPARPPPVDVPVTLYLEPVRFSRDEAQNAALAGAGLAPIPDYVYWVLLSRTANVHKNLPAAVRATAGSLPKSEARMALDRALTTLPPGETRELALELVKDFAPGLRALVELQLPQSAALRLTSAVAVHKDGVAPPPPQGKPGPDGIDLTGFRMQEWEPSPYVTLLGDAIHPMAPTGGSGANTVLHDVAALVPMFKQALSSVDTAQEEIAKGIAHYEEEMRKYAGAALQGSAFGGKHMYGQRPWDECKDADQL